jgi:hypothetical protein
MNERVILMTEMYSDETFLLADGFEDAIIGVDENTMRVIYSVQKCIGILYKTITFDDSVEHFEFNVKGSYMGNKTPIWCDDFFLEG